MGIADLIPGVSGGTIAFVCGIYEEFLSGIKTLQLHSMRKVAWAFLLPLGGGILCAVLFVSRLLYYLLHAFPIPLFAFFFGVIIASALTCGKKAALNRPSRWVMLLGGAFFAFLVAGMHGGHEWRVGFIPLMLIGMLAGGAMLLPGISGGYLLHILGIYPLALAALNALAAPGSLSLLIALTLGVSLGFICFSRAISWLITYFPTWTYAILVGFMLGGTRALWPFYKEGWVGALFSALIGFFTVILLELRMKNSSRTHSV